MPPGNAIPRATAKVTEKLTALECIEIARKVQLHRARVGDQAGSNAARLVAKLIQEDVLGERPLLLPIA